MIFLKLFLTFLEIGAVSFGGGYGMLSLIREKVIANAWMSEEQFMSFIAVSESTPGPIAVNMATFIGSSQGGLFGSFCATFGVILPSFIIILLIASVINNFIKYRGVRAFMTGVRPCVVALIISTAVTMGISTFFGIKNVIGTKISFDIRAVIIFAVVVVIRLTLDKMKKKTSPIIMIIISAALGIILYGLI